MLCTYVPSARAVSNSVHSASMTRPHDDAWRHLIGSRRARRMRVSGITYDTGFINAGTSTRELFDPAVVKRELCIIRDDLHCTAVRITGGDPDRLKAAATFAAAAGLEVWLSPFT